MPGYRGIFLDSIHPNIVKRLDYITFGFQRADKTQANNESLNRAYSTEALNYNPEKVKDSIDIYKYLQERTPWLRVVPFGQPAEYFESAKTEGGDPINIVEQLAVPNWRNWIMYGTKAAQIHSTMTDAGAPYTSRSHNVMGITTDGSQGLYNPGTTSWDPNAGPTPGMVNSPPPGISSLNVNNKGDLGTIRRASFDIKVHNLMDLEAIEMMYMVPGISVLIEWGWYHPALAQTPVSLDLIEHGNHLASTKAINTEILLKTFGIDDPLTPGNPELLNNFDEPLNQDTTWGPGDNGLKAGIYDGMLGIITKFNWSSAGDGSYDCRVDCISPGSLATGISVESYALGSAPVDEETNRQIPATDIATLAAVVSSKTRGIETDSNASDVESEYEAKLRKVRLITVSGDQGEFETSNKTKIKLPQQKLELGEFGVQITVKDGKVEFTEPAEPTEPDDVEYYIGKAGGGKRFQATTLRGQIAENSKWWEKVTTYAGKSPDTTWFDNLDVGAKGEDFIDCWNNAEDKRFGGVLNNVYQAITAGKYRVYYTGADKGWGKKVARDGTDTSKRRDWRIEIWNPIAKQYLGYTKDSRGQSYNWNNIHTQVNPVTDDDGNDTERFIEYPDIVTSDSRFFGISNNFMNEAKTDWAPKMEVVRGGEVIKTINYMFEFPGYKNETETKNFEKNNGITRADGKIKNREGVEIGTYDPEQGAYTSPVSYEKVDGLAIYKKEADGNVTLVSDAITETSATLIAQRMKTVLQNYAGDKVQEILSEGESEVNSATNLIMDVKNSNAVSWLSDPISDSIGFADETKYPDGVTVYAMNAAKSLPDLEIGYDIISTVDGPVFPVGCVAYNDTFISWRYIEDFLMNELYMPVSTVAEVTQTDEGETEDNQEQEISELRSTQVLENFFQSVVELSDREKKQFILEKGEGGATFEMIKKDGSDFTMLLENGILDVVTNQAIITQADSITNHPNLRSFNSKVCILPGQETTPEFPGGIKTNGDTLIGEANNLKVDPQLNKKNTFAVTSADGSKDFSQGMLRNILVNANIVMEAAIKEPNVRKFAGSVLNAINTACGNPWSFKIITNASTGQIKVVDENYVPKKIDYKVRLSNMNENGVYLFSGIGSDNILRDVKIQSKIPNELQTMAYYASLGSDTEKGSAINMFNMYRAGITDYLKNLTNVSIVGAKKSDEAEDGAKNSLLTSYAEMVGLGRAECKSGVKKNINVKAGMSLAKDYVKKYIHGDTIAVPNYSPPIPIDVSLELGGISGIYMGNAIMIRTISEGGLLPERYRNVVALQTTAVDHSVSPDGWTTSINTLMRPLPETAHADKRTSDVKIIPVPIKEPPLDNPPLIYPPLVPMVTTQRTIEELAAAVNQALGSTYAKPIKAGILWLAWKEQSFKGYNHNFYGVQTDIDWGAKLKPFINGSFNSREGKGGQGVGAGEGNERLFASFKSDAEGAKFVADRIKAKGWGNANADPASPNFITRKHIGSWLFGNLNNEAAKKVLATNLASSTYVNAAVNMFNKALSLV